MITCLSLNKPVLVVAAQRRLRFWGFRLDAFFSFSFFFPVLKPSVFQIALPLDSIFLRSIFSLLTDPCWMSFTDENGGEHDG